MSKTDNAKKKEANQSIDLTNAAEKYRDQLPDDLDITRAKAAYLLPSMTRRRWYAIFTWFVAAVSLLLWFTRGNGVFVNRASFVLGISLLILGMAFWFTGWPLNIRETDAVTRASKNTPFAIGHIAAQLGWQGFRSRPTWRVLLYSSENLPRERAVVLIDGVDGHVVFSEAEANPEDWSAELTTSSH